MRTGHGWHSGSLGRNSHMLGLLPYHVQHTPHDVPDRQLCMGPTHVHQLTMRCMGCSQRAFWQGSSCINVMQGFIPSGLAAWSCVPQLRTSASSVMASAWPFLVISERSSSAVALAVSKDPST